MAKKETDRELYAKKMAELPPLLPKLLTVTDMTKLTGENKMTILRYCRQGRFYGAQQLSNESWVFHPDWRILSANLEAKAMDRVMTLGAPENASEHQ